MSTINVLAPEFPESQGDATLLKWIYKVGEGVKHDDIIVQIETTDIVFDVPAGKDGTLQTVLVNDGSLVTSQQVIATIEL
ncbi:biotin/lipoyl-containing protein [Kitasatospora sp. NPDC003701]